MSKTIFDITISLDGYVAGPNQSREEGLGEGGEALHEWAFETAAFQEVHGRSGGEQSRDSEIMAELDAPGAEIMGRGKFGGGSGAWGSDPSFGEDWQGWWGEDPPFRKPVFVLTHHEREPLTLGETTFTFVSDGIESALEQAREAAGDKDVLIGGGAKAIQQYLGAGLIDEFQLHVSPMMLGSGARLFDNLDRLPDLELLRTVESPAVTHLKYRVLNS
ncbi:MAG: dihydrofolate reductase family protein [Solirubrobacterales bacterium]